MSRQDVVIIGAGIIGSSIAYHLAKQGIPSQIIERDGIAARASGKAWAVWSYPPFFLLEEMKSADDFVSTPKGSIRPWLELLWLGYHRLPDIALELREETGIDIGFSEYLRLRVALSERSENRLRIYLTFLTSEGFNECGWLEANDLIAIFPDVNTRARGALVSPGLQAEPYKYTLSLIQAAERRGANIKQGEAVGFRHQGSRVTSVILATGTEVEADVVVLAMGPWSGQGTSWLGKEIPIVINKEQCLRVEVAEPLPKYALSAGGAMILPMASGDVILGTTRMSDPQGDFDNTLTEEIKSELLESAVSLLPRLQESRLVEHRGDLLGWAPAPYRLQPVLGRLPEWDNVYIAARLSQGMQESLGVGRVMSDLIVAGGRAPTRVKAMMEFLDPARLC